MFRNQVHQQRVVARVAMAGMVAPLDVHSDTPHDLSCVLSARTDDALVTCVPECGCAVFHRTTTHHSGYVWCR